MSEPAEPTVSFSTRVDIATDQRRRRLQKRTGWSSRQLISEALRVVDEAGLADRLEPAGDPGERAA